MKALSVQRSSEFSLGSIGDLAQWSLRFRMFFLGCAYTLLLAIGGVVTWSGSQYKIQVLTQELQILQARYLTYAQQVELLPTYQRQVAQIVEQFGSLLDAIPAALESVYILKQITLAAKESGLHLELFKPLAEEVQPYYVVLPVEIRLRGDYSSMARFLEVVSKMKHLITVDVVIAPAVNDEGQIVLASLLKAYRYREIPAQKNNKSLP